MYIILEHNMEHSHIQYTVFILIEARRASAGIFHILKWCLFEEKTIIVIERPLTPYKLVFIVI